jgi:hypothetical protein
VFLDIETLPCEADDPLWDHLAVRYVPLQERDQVRQSTGLTPVLGRVWMVGVARRHEPVTVFAGDGSPAAERDVLLALLEYLRPLRAPWLCGHNVEGFDIPFLQARAIVHDNELGELAYILGPHGEKPWDRRVLDTRKLFPATTWKDVPGLAKLDTLCRLLGIPPQDGLMGDGVYQAWLEGRQDEVEAHLRADVEQVRALLRRLWSARLVPHRRQSQRQDHE